MSGTVYPGITLRQHYAGLADVPWDAVRETLRDLCENKPTMGRVVEYRAAVMLAQADALLAALAQTAPVAEQAQPSADKFMVKQLTAVLQAAGAPEFDNAQHAQDWADSVRARMAAPVDARAILAKHAPKPTSQGGDDHARAKTQRTELDTPAPTDNATAARADLVKRLRKDGLPDSLDAADAIESLTAQLAEAQKDSARLQHLIVHHGEMCVTDGHPGRGIRFKASGGFQLTTRDMIDQDIAAMQAGGGK